ncbi:MAG: archease [Candidatus Altiarchaeota archaeon]|nr:archease [Candidatus Altiarchaeota archaeon]
MGEGFEYLEHTADLKFRSRGRTLGEAFENAGLALFTAITDLSKVEARENRRITLEAEELDMLLHDFLSELIYLFSAEEMLFSGFKADIVKIDTYQLHATVSGEKIDRKKHLLQKEVKAATFHDMKIEQGLDGWVIEVVCDT